MQEKVYFSFLIVCAILSQGIIAKVLEEDVGESSKLLVRQKRVIARGQGAETPLSNGNAPYIVNLRRERHLHCIATILSKHNVITAARCVNEELRVYTVVSGSVYTHRGTEHNVTDRQTHSNTASGAFLTGVAVLTVRPPFEFSLITKSIDLHSGPVLADMDVKVFGWGTHANSGPIETIYPKRLRSITVPIMNHRACQDLYRYHFAISEEYICTYHSKKLCGDTDVGAPLVIDDQLVGVHIGRILTFGRDLPVRPDVFILLQHLNYRSWIMRHIVH